MTELGPALEQKFLNEGRISKESALEQLEKFLMGVYETEKAALLAALREEEKLEYGSQLKKIQDYYDAEICKIVTECYEQIERLKEEMAEEVDSINIFWKDRAQQEINETVAKVTGTFLDKMKLQEQILVSIYIKQIRLNWVKVNKINVINVINVGLSKTRKNALLISSGKNTTRR